MLSAQSELEASRARYQELYDAAPVGYVMLSNLGHIEEINLTAAKLLGFSRRQVLRQPLLIFIGRDDRRKFMRYLAEMRRNPARRSVEVQLARRTDAPAVFVEIVSIPSSSQSGATYCFQSALIDITARRQAEVALRESEERFRTLARSAPVGIFLCNAKGETTYVNDAWCAMTGIPLERGLGYGWLNAVHPEDRKRIEDGWKESVHKSASSSAEFRFLRPDGNILWVQGRAIHLRNASGQRTGSVGTVADITDRKRAETEMSQAHTEILAASRAKDDFLAMLSHELRTPLNPVLLLAGDDARNRDLPPGVRADFDAIRRNIETEARLIDDLLDITRINHGKLTLEKQPLEIHEVLRSALATVQNEISKKNIDLKLALNASQHTVMGDPVRLQQVFWNVLRNAIKFTPENGIITVETDSAGPTFSLKVCDTGVGIALDDLKIIFDAFSQGSQSGRGGLGLGLAISKRLVEMHSGSIQAFSQGKYRGATFSISLPVVPAAKATAHVVYRPAPPVPPPASPAGKPTRRARILLVEDHEPTRTALMQLLLRRRFEVTGAGSVAEAKSRVDQAKQDFDLLISDIGLPDGNGYDLMNDLRVAHKLAGIALTGYGMEEDVQRSHAAGFTTHLTKPVKIESLDHALAAALGMV